MSGTIDQALVAAATSTAPFVTPTLPLNDPLLQVPAIVSDEMYAHLKGPELPDLTTKVVNGAGAFDGIMVALKAHLREEFEKNRITGAEYTKAYLETVQMGLSGAIQFLLGKEQAFWQAQRAQIDAVAGRVELETKRVQLNRAQLDAMAAQFTLSQLLPKQRDLLVAQIAGATLDNQIKTYNVSYILPAQRTLLLEQGEAQRGQTSDYRSDGSMVAGVMGSQKALYAQQVVSYKRDGQLKVAKLFADAWTIQKTVDEGLDPPANFTNDQVNSVMGVLRNVNELG
ncbi:hypothetical protein [Roseococcus sp.]|uniref:hypothetical protein n=1 Tax=Roseococcus sp. TaxID=2109646 RepID=UPI003BA99B3A